MKNLLLIFPLILLIGSCKVQVSTGNSLKTVLEVLKKKDYNTLYNKHISVHTKSHVPREKYDQMLEVNDDLVGGLISAKLQSTTTGKFRNFTTQIYHYEAKYSKIETPVDLTIEMLDGFVLRLLPLPSKWYKETPFITELTSPVKDAIQKKDLKILYSLLGPYSKKRYTESYYINAITPVVNMIEGQETRLESVTVDSDVAGEIYVAFDYDVDEKFTLTLTYYYQNNQYLQAGIGLTKK